MKRLTPRAIRALAIVYFVFGVGPLLWLLMRPSMVLGEGRLALLWQWLEAFDFRWLWLGLWLAAWLAPPLIAAATWLLVRQSLLERGMLPMLSDLLREQTIPLAVHLSQRLPIQFDQEIRIPIRLRAHVDIERDIEIAARVPIRTTLDVDTIVTTRVPAIGDIRIPIRTRIPIDLEVPVQMPVHVSLKQLPVEVDEEVAIRLPAVEAPIDARLQMRVRLFET